MVTAGSPEQMLAPAAGVLLPSLCSQRSQWGGLDQNSSEDKVRFPLAQDSGWRSALSHCPTGWIHWTTEMMTAMGLGGILRGVMGAEGQGVNHTQRPTNDICS